MGVECCYGLFDGCDVLFGQNFMETDKTKIVAGCVFDEGRLAIEFLFDRFLGMVRFIDIRNDNTAWTP